MVLPKVNFYPALPWQFRKLLERHSQAFKERKAKDYVKTTLRKRIRVLACNEPLAKSTHEDWLEATGQNIIDSYTCPDAGTVLSRRLDCKETVPRILEAMPAVETRIVR